jgi:hypothetical protein
LEGFYCEREQRNGEVDRRKCLSKELGVVVHVFITKYSGDRRIRVQGQLGQKLAQDPISRKIQV